jgi:5-formyltetrahydrofolate cyclo-ligase
VKASRRAVPDAQHAAEARALQQGMLALPGTGPGDTVCCYVPFGTEPGSIAMLDALAGAGARVLLPIVTGRGSPLQWAEYTGPSSLAPGELPGLQEPVGARLGPDALLDAGLVLVPAFAVDRGGARLGKGAGYYDMSLGLAAEGGRRDLVAVVRDDEVVDALPAEPHDVRMTAVLTPTGLRSLPLAAAWRPGTGM